jgi:hypothetical protein
MVAAARHRVAGAKHPVDGRPQRLGAVDDKQLAAFRVNPSGHQVFQ